MSKTHPLTRRSFLQGVGGATLSLPLLEAMRPVAAAAEKGAAVPRRLVAMNFGLGLYGKGFFPEQAGRDYELSPYLQRLADHRDEMTVISGLYHDGVGGGHASEAFIYTGVPNEGGGSFKNGISLDELIAERLGAHTRFASLRMGHQATHISWNRQGVAMPFETDIQEIYHKLFGIEKEQDRQLQRERLATGRSILDLVGDSARRMRRDVSTLDRAKLDEYFDSVRDVEQRLAKDQAWFDRPKPEVALQPPKSRLGGSENVIARMRMYFDLIHLALQTDSTRCLVYAPPTTATILLPGENITNSYHNLTHHGKDPENIRQMMLIDKVQMDEVSRFLTKLKETQEEGDRLLDRTTVMITSNLGNGAGHGCKDLPVLVAGGKLKHGQHLSFDPPNTTPLANLYVSLLQNVGIETDRFALSTGTLSGIERA